MISTAPTSNHWVEQDLQNGWTKREDVVAETPEELNFVLDSMGVSRDSVDVKPAYWNQDRPFIDADGNPDTVNFVPHTSSPEPIGHAPTYGFYHNIIIPTSGTIIASSNYSPKFKSPSLPILPLNRWSDIVWLSWLAVAGDDSSSLVLIFRNNIITQSTRDLLEYIHGARQDDLLLPWPGKEYDPRSTKEGEAILARSHGVGVAWLLRDYGDVLGKRVPVARVFTVSSGEVRGDEGALDDDADGDGDDEDEFVYYCILWELRGV
ncbi:MAG: hypothetical protein Q9226_002918 [Calogaya cf. arnoldii]